MKPFIRRMPWILAAILGGYSLTCLLLLGIFNAWDIALPPWAESVYLAVFIAPVLILCWPWYPLLSRWGMMEGEWFRLPSLTGIALVIGTYILVFLAAGWLMNRNKD